MPSLSAHSSIPAQIRLPCKSIESNRYYIQIAVTRQRLRCPCQQRHVQGVKLRLSRKMPNVEVLARTKSAQQAGQDLPNFT